MQELGGVQMDIAVLQDTCLWTHVFGHMSLDMCLWTCVFVTAAFAVSVVWSVSLVPQLLSKVKRRRAELEVCQK